MSGFTNALANALAPQEKLYIFSFDLLHQGFSIEGLTTYIMDARQITSWSYVNPGVYLIRSYEGAQTLTSAFRAITGGARLMIAEINLTNTSGHLPNAAWEWLYRLPSGTLGNPVLEAPKNK